MATENEKNILVYIETIQGKLTELSCQLLSKAYQLSKDLTKSQVTACLITRDQDISQVSKLNICRLHLYKKVPTFFEAEIWAAYLTDCLKKERPELVLIGSSVEGKAIAPFLSVAFRTGLTADCTELSIGNKQEIIQTRPAYGGNVFADIITTTRPQICTIRKDTFGVSEDIFSTTKTCDIIQHNLKKVPRIAGLSTMRIKYSEKQLLNADLSLIVGNALRDEEDLKLFYQLAELLDCELYGTRPVIERGLLDPDKQIGLSGNKLKSTYALVFGVSGSVQFYEGVKHVKNIIAVNNDKHARIFSFSNYPFLGDMYDIVKVMIDKLTQ